VTEFKRGDKVIVKSFKGVVSSDIRAWNGTVHLKGDIYIPAEYLELDETFEEGALYLSETSGFVYRHRCGLFYIPGRATDKGRERSSFHKLTKLVPES
jgi:hypothetical protein